MNKILNPKLLAKITIITIILGFILSIISNIIFYDTIIDVIIDFVLNIFTAPSSYILIYLLIVLNKKEKDMRKLNLALLICIIITSIIPMVGQIIMINETYSIDLSVANIANFQMWFNLITSTLHMILEIVMIYGILRKTKMPYKVLMVILIILTFTRIIPFILSSISYINNTKYLVYNPILIIKFNLLNLINGIICSCSFILFLYLYGKNINERSLKNGR